VLQIVIQVTDRTRKERHSQYTGVKLFSKVVTAMLLVLLGAGPLPLIAATQCQEHAKASVCCAADCPMMAVMTKGRPHSRIDSSRCECQVTPSTPALKANEQILRESGGTLLTDNTSALLRLHATSQMALGHLPPHPAPGSHSQSALCTFQI